MSATRQHMRSARNPLERTRIMVVEDDEIQGELLTDILITEGYDVALATSGEMAVELYQSYEPDVILMDVVMRGISGYQAARMIKELCPETFVPIIFITSLDSLESVMSCLESGGVDCIVKPCNPIVLNQKIKTFKDISKLYRTVKEQRDKLEVHTKYLESSYAVAEDVLNKVMQSNVLKSAAIKYFLSPIAIFNGDILLAAYRPTGELHVMLGDFTGHGISAAIGAIPVADIFYGMTGKGFSITEIIEEINTKVKRILPRGLFLAASLIEYNPDSRKMTVWNAGLPDLIFFDKSGVVRERAESKNFPLGVNSTVSLIHTMDVYQLNEGDRMLMLTDGLIEAKNECAEPYGMQRVLKALGEKSGPWKIDEIYDDFTSFVGDSAIADDITMIEIDLDAMAHPIVAKNIQDYPKPVVNAEWKINFCFGPDILRQVDPLPNIVQTLMDLQKLQKFKQDIFIILKELFINAVDHGLLRLDSATKQDFEGFSRYMQEREKRLEQLDQGIISIELIHKASPDGGILDVFVFDSGDGFDVKKLEASLDTQNHSYHGRGLLLVKHICQSVEFNEKGNEVHARYQWQA